jgi:hypothetical protein
MEDAMAVHAIELPAIHHDRQTGRIEIHVCSDGGWNVTAIVDDKVVATRHCHDWHRVERTRRLLESELEIHSA